MAVEAKISCDKCKESFELKLEMVSRETFHAAMPSGFERLDKMIPLNDGSGKSNIKRFLVCGACLGDHRRQSERLFEMHFEGLK